jgi:hypothetical protein
MAFQTRSFIDGKKTAMIYQTTAKLFAAIFLYIFILK